MAGHCCTLLYISTHGMYLVHSNYLVWTTSCKNSSLKSVICSPLHSSSTLIIFPAQDVLQSYFKNIYVVLVAVCSLKYFSFPACSPAVILEVGSGSGVVSAFLASMIGPSALYLWVIQPRNVFFLFCQVTHYCVSLPSSCTDVNPAAAQCTAKTSSSNKVSLQPVITSLVSFQFLLFCLWSHRILVFDENCITLWSRRELCVVSSKWWVQERWVCHSLIFYFDDWIVW